jgi:hypothetical protein
MRVDVQVASAFFSGVNFLLALAIHFGTFYIFSAGRQLGSVYPALSLAPNVSNYYHSLTILKNKFACGALLVYIYTKIQSI